MFLTSFFIVLTSLVISVLRTVFFERIEDSSTYVGVLMTFVNSVEDNILGQVETLPLLAAMLLHVVNFSVLFYKDFWGIISGHFYRCLRSSFVIGESSTTEVPLIKFSFIYRENTMFGLNGL